MVQLSSNTLKSITDTAGSVYDSVSNFLSSLGSDESAVVKEQTKNTTGASNLGLDTLLTTLAARGLNLTGTPIQPVGYQGSIPDYTAVRARVPNTYDPNRRPGSGVCVIFLTPLLCHQVQTVLLRQEQLLKNKQRI